MTAKSYDYYAKQTYSQAMTDHTVNPFDVDEVVEYSEEIADLLVLDRELLAQAVRDNESFMLSMQVH